MCINCAACLPGDSPEAAYAQDAVGRRTYSSARIAATRLSVMLALLLTLDSASCTGHSYGVLHLALASQQVQVCQGLDTCCSVQVLCMLSCICIVLLAQAKQPRIALQPPPQNQGPARGLTLPSECMLQIRFWLPFQHLLAARCKPAPPYLQTATEDLGTSCCCRQAAQKGGARAKLHVTPLSKTGSEQE